MEANNESTKGGEFAARMEATQRETAHRFEVRDLDFDATHRFPSAGEASAKAEALGLTRFQHVDAHGVVAQVQKEQGEWTVAGKPLSGLQGEIDREALRGIEARAEARAAAGQGVSAQSDNAMAIADAHAFKRIEDRALQESAAVEMAYNAREFPQYRAGLEQRIPAVSGVAEQVAALDAEHSAKVREKEDRKTAAFEAHRDQERAQAAAWSPEEAAQHAQRDAAELVQQADKTERFYMGADMARNAEANPHYAQALEKAGPDVVAEVEASKESPVVVVNAQAQGAANDDHGAKEGRAANDEAAPAALAINPADLERVAESRARDSQQAREALGLNTVEPHVERERQELPEAQDAQRSAWLKKSEPTQPAPAPAAAPTAKAPAGNHVESDEIFTARQPEVAPVVPPEVEKQYLHVGNKFYHSKNTDLVAFEDKGNKLETKSNSEAIAESMVRVAEARGWDEIKVSGSETFRKEVWLEAASRGMQVRGYTPSEQDKAELAKRETKRPDNKVEKGADQFRGRETDEAKPAGKPASEAPKSEPPKPESPNQRLAETFAKETPESAVKKHPELAGAAAALAAIDKRAEADGLNAQQRAIVMARAKQNVVNSIERGNIPEAKIREEVEVKREREPAKEATR